MVWWPGPWTISRGVRGGRYRWVCQVGLDVRMDGEIWGGRICCVWMVQMVLRMLLVLIVVVVVVVVVVSMKMSLLLIPCDLCYFDCCSLKSPSLFFHWSLLFLLLTVLSKTVSNWQTKPGDGL